MPGAFVGPGSRFSVRFAVVTRSYRVRRPAIACVRVGCRIVVARQFGDGFFLVIVVVVVVVFIIVFDVDLVVFFNAIVRPAFLPAGGLGGSPGGVAARLGFGPRLGSSLFRGFGGGFLFKQGLTVGNRDLVVIGVDFVEGKEAMAVAAVVDKGRLQGRLDARYLGQIDIAAQLFARSGFIVEFLYAASA